MTKPLAITFEAADKKGFTLIETMIAMGIFAIGILAVASLQITAFQGNRSARLHTEALSLAEQQLEELAARAYDSPQLANGSHSESDVGPANRFDLAWTITEDTPLPGTKIINLTIAWDNRGSRRRMELNHIVTNL